jgi:hypothetical protein
MTNECLGIATLLTLGLAACSENRDDANITVETVNAAKDAYADLDVQPLSEGNAIATPEPEALPANVIPAQYRGRWGMVPADCEAGRSDAKGLITISDTTIKFYESLASLKEQRPAIATSFSGQFAFSGEGQDWIRVQTLTRTGNTMKRADEEGSYTYTRCA